MFTKFLYITVQNNFGMHHLLVPQVVMQNKYSPRDPSQSDNWRGRPRQDIVQVDIQTVGKLVLAVVCVCLRHLVFG